MLTRKAKYALKALMVLAHEKRPMLISEISTKERIPKKFLELILLELKRGRFLESKTGRGGGYHLRMKPDDISIGSIVRLLDGPLAQIPCASQTAYSACDECEDEETCAIRQVMTKVRDATAGILDHTTLAQLVRKNAQTQRRKRTHAYISSRRSIER
jgi:Rrf2 family protein